MNNNYFNPNMFRGPIATNGFGNIGTRGISSVFANSAPRVMKAATATSKITFSGILNGASKTLGVINQAIPVFYQVKPIWKDAKTMFRVAKEINSPNDTKEENNTNTTLNNTTKKESNNSPTFFI